ncbi:hypothetical protein D3C85_1531730 [compost metagenome]
MSRGCLLSLQSITDFHYDILSVITKSAAEQVKPALMNGIRLNADPQPHFGAAVNVQFPEAHL